MTKMLFIVLSIFYVNSLVCQNSSSKSIEYKDTTTIEKISLKMAYYGVNSFHAGIKLGLEYPIFRKIKEIPRFPLNTKLGIMKNKGYKTIHKDWIVSLNFTFYNHNNNHTGLWLTPEFSKRRTGRRGGFKEFSYGL